MQSGILYPYQHTHFIYETEDNQLHERMIQE